jgi:hypothetical protein
MVRVKWTPRKGKPGSGDGIDQVANERARSGRELPVLAAERDDARGALAPGTLEHAVGVETRAVDRHFRAELPRRRADRDIVRARDDAESLGARDDATARLGDPLREPIADRAVVDDAGAGDVEGAKAGSRGLELAQALGPDELASDAVRLAPFEERFEARELGRVDGDDHFSARLERDRLPRAQLLHPALAAEAVRGLQRAGLVVDARVEDARVVAGLVLADAGFLLEDDDLAAGEARLEAVRRREPDDSAADDDQRHRSTRRRTRRGTR